MNADTYNIELKGYWRDKNKGGIPNHSGIYFVYECTYNQDRGTVIIHKLIYIGESETVRDRIANHDKLKDWLKHVRKRNTLCYSTGKVESGDRKRIEAALINNLSPPENERKSENFPYKGITIVLTGRNALLPEMFTVS